MYKKVVLRASNKLSLRLFALLVLFSTAMYVLSIVVFPANNELEVVNNSSSVINDGRVTITGQDFVIQSLTPGTGKHFTFATYFGEPVYTADFILSTGKRLNSTSGYICRGVKNHVTITVNSKDDLEFDCSAR